MIKYHVHTTEGNHTVECHRFKMTESDVFFFSKEEEVIFVVNRKNFISLKIIR